MLSIFKWAITTLRHHDDQVAALRAEIEQRDQRIAELESNVKAAEKRAHQIAEETRYTLEAAAEAIQKDDAARGEALASLAYALPYVLSGRRHWDDWPCTRTAEGARELALKVTRQYGFELPDVPTVAVKSMLELASMIFLPGRSLPVESWRQRYPVSREQQ